MIVTYIPTEIVTIYVAAVSALHSPSSGPGNGQWVLMWVTLALTPVVTWISYALKMRADGGPLPRSARLWPWPEMVVASVAFLLWAFSLPSSPFETLDWYRPGLSAFALLAGTTLIGLVMALLRPVQGLPQSPSEAGHTTTAPAEARSAGPARPTESDA
ncbi:hypothetical protein MUK60_11985 [Streptomyces sp. LRE541]|uniref:hypothetical protein n=1 Tax=Streptomyces sp. LRE541 TaxID=2931983 RepID=UPI00200C9954|nr:hypothetical protein [Streptomyces sp. LRE541]UPZ28475.1 hypothetical protein MUK60_11985 [Streptomyces sp. LRE541]